MAVYVDPIQSYPIEFVAPAARQYGTLWCHLTADTPRELMDMARKLRLSPVWMQRSSSGIIHFDLVPSKRREAIKHGAIEISTRETVMKAEGR